MSFAHSSPRFSLRIALRATVLLSAVFTAACGGPTADAHTVDRVARSVAASVGDSIVSDSIARARQDSINRTLPGYVVDSILPPAEQMERFQKAIGGTAVTALQHSSPSRDALVARFVTALSAGDSTELRAMAVSAREFADVIFPDSPNVKPPYQQDPALVWRMIENHSQSGFIRLVRRAGGIPVHLAGYRCDPTPTRQGRNTLWSGCLLDLVAAPGDTSTHRFFGSIVERQGRFKIMSYRNEF